MPVSPAIQAALDAAVRDGVFPGAVLAVRKGGSPIQVACAGHLSTHPPGEAVTASAIYDLASLTKPLATVTAIALLVQEGRCHLEDSVEALLPECAGVPIGGATVRHLLTHSSGLPGWRGYYERLSPAATIPATEEARGKARQAVLPLVCGEALIYERGARSLYSDIGFILLGLIVERCSGMHLDRFFDVRIARLAGAGVLRFIPVEDLAAVRQGGGVAHGGIAPTEVDSWRGRLLCGEVHDENAAALGGVAGHAGLFGTAESVLAVTGGWLRAYSGQPSWLDSAIVRAFTARQQRIPGSSWALGWDTPSSPSSSGQYFSASSFGHLGYTGTSLWIDPDKELEVVLLSNRVHPTRKNDLIRAFRPTIHDVVWREYAGTR
ncbi:MAG: serine hydrolase [Nitrospira sp.]|nr:serine hydrolase [Nitrospira sp.]